jgi:hypothetical protein|tara:strand:+ start:154 stop:657 length:504 start_codon:yes stop_codon:yes gene_type:complete
MTLIIGSIQYTSADHSLGGQGIFKDENNVNLTSSMGSKYLIHLQVVVRDAQDQLVSVTESIHGSYIPHELTDQIFDENMGKKEIINIDKIRYEKVEFIQIENVQQYSFLTSFQDMQSMWSIEFCLQTNEHGNEQGISCIPVFQTITPDISLGEDDVFTSHWTILREF